MSNEPKFQKRSIQPKSAAKKSKIDSTFWKKLRSAEIIAPLSAAISITSAITAIWQAQVANEVAVAALADERRSRAPDLNPRDVVLTPLSARNQKVNLLSAVWVNSGQTPTVGLTRASGCGGTPAAAHKAMKLASGTLTLAPGATILSGGCVMRNELIGHMISTEMPYFITGKAIYQDQFGNKYSKSICYGVVIYKGNTPSQVVMQNLSCGSYKCDKDSCKIKALDSYTDLAEEAARN